ncbi:MAG: exosortase/archaeosortase family protein [Bacteroidales bacterium]|nr:exosortase/archaeosortase family protein [Bacteroidales bacterium]
MKKFLNKINDFVKKHKLSALREVFIFCTIAIIVHFLYRYWANELNYKPIATVVMAAQDFMAQLVISYSQWILSDIFNINITIVNDRIYLPNNGWVGVGSGCSAFKPMVQFLILMLLYPGPWKKKLWFIPLGFLLIHFTNVIRIVTLSLITHNNHSQEFWDLTHDYILRPLFYAIIFTMWVIWVEIISKKTDKNNKSYLSSK